MTGQLTLFGHPCPICGQHHLRQPAGQPVQGRPIPPATHRPTRTIRLTGGVL